MPIRHVWIDGTLLDPDSSGEVFLELVDIYDQFRLNGDLNIYFPVTLVVLALRKIRQCLPRYINQLYQHWDVFSVR